MRKPFVKRNELRNTRDPRFDPLSGHLDLHGFRNSYNFLKDQKLTENTRIKKLLRQKKNKLSEGEKSQLRQVLQKNNSDLNHDRMHREELSVKNELKSKIKGTRKGRDRIFVKKGDIKKKVLERKYEKLESEGKLDQYMAKKKKWRNIVHMKKYRGLKKKMVKDRRDKAFHQSSR